MTVINTAENLLGQQGRAHPEPGDLEAIDRVLGGEVNAFEVLVERHGPTVARIVGRKVPYQEVAEVTHEVFIRAFESLGNYRPLKPLDHWLATLAVRTCYDFWREHYRRRETPLADLTPEHRAWLEDWAAGQTAGPAAGAGEYEAWELVDWALGRLSPEDRMTLTLVHLEEMPVAEAAELLGWSRAKVKVRAFRARRKLRELIAGELSPEEV